MIGSFLAAVRIALRAIRRNMLRATLTVLGILIGVTSVVTVTALGTGARENVGNQIQSLGSNFIIIFPQSAAVSGAKGAQGVGARLTEDDGRAIKNESVSIAAVAPVLRARAQVVFADKNTSTSIIGSTQRSFSLIRASASAPPHSLIFVKLSRKNSDKGDRISATRRIVPPGLVAMAAGRMGFTIWGPSS